MRYTAIFFAGFMIASAAIARASDPMAEERYRLKYGRYTPAEEARRAAARRDVSQELYGACCRTAHRAPESAAVAGDASGQEARFAAKYGRISPQAEARQKALDAELAVHVKKCVEISQCSRKHAVVNPMTAGTPVPTDRDLRLWAKYGVAVPSQIQRAHSSQERGLVASELTGGCEHECCKHSD